MNTEYKILSKLKTVIFTIGHIGPGMLNQFITLNIIFYFTEELEVNAVSGTVIGFIILLGRIMDGVADPLVASWSDNLYNKKYGRRLPFIAIGTIPMILSFIVIWLAPLINNDLLRILVLALSINGFYFFYTVVVNPYFALIPDVSDKETRSFLQSFVALFGIIGMGLAFGTSRLIYGITGSMVLTSLIFGFIALLTMLAPILTLKTNEEFIPAKKVKFSLKLLVENVKTTLQVKEFSTYLIGFAMFYFGFQLIQYSLLFIVTKLYNLDGGVQGTAFIVSVVSALLFIPVVNIIIKKTSVENMLKISLFSFGLVSIIIVLVSIIGQGNANLVYLVMFLLGFPYSGLMMVPNLIVSKIIDKEHKNSENKNEAMFFGTQGLINKITLAFAGFCVGIIVDINNSFFGICIIVLVSAVFAFVGYIFLKNYKIEV